MPVFVVFSVYDTVWKAAVSSFRSESVMIKLGLNEVSWPPSREGSRA